MFRTFTCPSSGVLICCIMAYYGITPHAAVIQHISTPEDGHVNVRNM